MMRKHFRMLSLILALILTLAVGAAFTACNSGGDEQDKTTAGNNEVTKAPTTTEEETTNGTPEDDGKVTYTVLIKDADGNPIAGVEVQVCEGTTCKTPRQTDENGSASWTFQPKGTDPVKVQINKVPDGYVIPEADADGYHDKFANGATEVTVTLEKAAAAE